LLIANCDEFIYYDDLVRGQQKRRPRKKAASTAAAPVAALLAPATVENLPAAGLEPAPAAATEAAAAQPEEEVDRKQKALDLVLQTVEALITERGAEEKIWGSMVKQALKRRNPGFNESYYGFRSFSKLLDEAAARKLLDLEHDEKSGGVIIKALSSDY
jgi:hypothetical protein